MKDYRLLTNRKIYTIVYKEIKKIAPLCVDNREGMNNEQKELFINQIIKKLNINIEQALFLLKDKSGNYREKLLQIDGIEEKKTFDSVINYLDVSKHNIPFMLVLIGLFLLEFLVLEIMMIINKELFLIAIFACLIVFFGMVTICLLFRLKKSKNLYDKLFHDDLIEEKVNVSKIKLQIVGQFSNHPPHIVWVIGIRIIGKDTQGKKLKLIYPLDTMIHNQFDFIVKRKFSKIIKKYYKDYYFIYMKHYKYVLESKIDFKHIIEKI